MTEPEPGAKPKRFKVIVEENPPRGDLYELEQTTRFYVVDEVANQTIMTFESEMEAGLSRESGTWDDFRYSGVRDVTISTDEKSAIVRYYNGKNERFPLPC